ncbi:DMT family transporter [Sporomusa malonica]|uniref:Permease of the drug/metabolite transporter (DMT) superfamily n=1 Tax=Sporomusa malonica TaxID=112901 RepID=A0A1W1ZRJ7_9FIRM|nr:DMT family transporter [Sporomusa malonica]SMC50688.1 Permease of the drug/metabolite transporter (DMT) superfamily [Sporomusa malonica]
MHENIIETQERVKFRDRTYLIANIMMFVTIVFWGISFISIKIAVEEVPPVTMALLRFVIASVMLWVLLKKIEPDTKIEKADIPKMILAGCLGITLYFYFENIGVKLTTAVNASLIVTIVPIIAIALDVVFFGAPVSPYKLAGIVIAVGGTYLSVTANGELDFNSANFIGNLLVVGAMLAWVFYTLVNKSLQNKYSGLYMTTYQTIIGTVFLLPLSLTEYSEWQVFSLTALWHILFLAIFCSVICYLLYMYALKHLDVAITTLYLNLVPVVGVMGGYFILGESVLPIQLVGGLLTLLAIVIINFERPRQVAQDL